MLEGRFRGDSETKITCKLVHEKCPKLKKQLLLSDSLKLEYRKKAQKVVTFELEKQTIY